MRYLFLLGVVAVFGYLLFILFTGNPLTVAKTCVESAISIQEKIFYGCSCESERDEFMDIMVKFDLSLLPKLSNANWDFSNLDYKLIEKDFNEAIVHVSGEWSVEGFGLDKEEYIDMTIRLIKEYGRWKVCGLLE